MRPGIVKPLSVCFLSLTACLTMAETGLGQSAVPPAPTLPIPALPDPAGVAAVTELIDEDLPTLGPIRELVNLPTAVIAARRHGPRPVALYQSPLSGAVAEPGPVADRPPGLPKLAPDLTARARILTGGSSNPPGSAPFTNPSMVAASSRLTWMERLAGLIPSTTTR